MIYLIQDCYKDDNGYHDILKIGYSDKEFEGSRGKEYNTHNFGYRLLDERPGGKDLETHLHKHFNKYRLSREWFEYNDEIVNTFFDIELPEYEACFKGEDDPTILYPRVDYLKTVYRRKIIDPDFLLGTDESIEVRIEKSMKIATDFWYYISEHGDQAAENKMEERQKTTKNLMNVISDEKSVETQQDFLKAIKDVNTIANDNYIYVSGESFGEYKAIFDEGKYKIEKLALEIFRLETLKI